MKKTAIELFAGVGGFRVGLNSINKIDVNGRAIENDHWTFLWANQWEPSTKSQDAFICYVTRFGDENNSNVDISKVNKKEIPEHTLLCGGFPCQDYSVARSLSQEKGIEGKKGVQVRHEGAMKQWSSDETCRSATLKCCPLLNDGRVSLSIPTMGHFLRYSTAFSASHGVCTTCIWP